MSDVVRGGRRLPWDWYDGVIPDNVVVADDAYVESAFSFLLCRSERDVAVELRPGAHTYVGTMFDVGPSGHVVLGEFALVGAARFICDAEIEIGDYAAVSWNTLFMDSYRVPRDPVARRQLLAEVAGRADRDLDGAAEARPIKLEADVWIGFEVCVLPGVTIGEGSIVGAKSVVYDDVPPYTIAAGNPARPIKSIPKRTA